MTMTSDHPAVPTTPDLRPLLGAAFDQVERFISTTDPADAGLPTPCDEWDVDDLIGHLIAVVRRIGVVLQGLPPFSVPSMVESTDWVGDWAHWRAETDQVLADDAVLDLVVQVPWGTVTGAQAIGSYVGELATHSWDLAMALGRSGELDESLAEAALPAILAKIPAEPRDQIPFGPVVEVGPEASPSERIVAWQGRDPGWRRPTA
ncbi:MAG: TIGR03086 family metal-binding protein [Nocardioidaceae bacterium]